MKELIMKIILYFLSLYVFFACCIIFFIKIPSSHMTFFSVFFEENLLIIIIAIFLTLALVLSLKYFNRYVSGTGELPAKVIHIEDANVEHLSFLLTCILPLISIFNASVNGMCVAFLLIIVVGFIFIKTNIFYQNPTLLLFGFKLYSITILVDNKEVCYKAITTACIKENDYVKWMKLCENVCCVRRKDAVI